MPSAKHYHEARVLGLKDIDGNIQTLNTRSQLAGDHGCWVCARVIDLREDGYLAIFFYLDNFREAIDTARSRSRS